MIADQGFAGLSVLSLESRRAPEMAKLIENCGGRPVVAPAMKEVPLESHSAALEFAGKLMSAELDMVIFLTGVGTRALARVIETVHPRQKFVEALRRVIVVARGSKPASVLREMQVPISILVPEPNTWRELLQAIDDYVKVNSEADALLRSTAESGSFKMKGCRIAVQEYGVSNPELISGLEARGGVVNRVPVYQWTLPEDTGPLKAAVTALINGEIQVALFTSSAQVQHLLQIAATMGSRDRVLRAFDRVLVASIGPVTSQELRDDGIVADLEPSHPKMGILVRETAEKSRQLLQAKRSRPSV